MVLRSYTTISWSRRLQQESTLEVLFPPYFGFESFWLYMVGSCYDQKLLCSLCVYKWILSHFQSVLLLFSCGHAFLLKSFRTWLAIFFHDHASVNHKFRCLLYKLSAAESCIIEKSRIGNRTCISKFDSPLLSSL